MKRCPLCDSSSIAMIERGGFKGASFLLHQCRECLVIINKSAYDLLNKSSERELQKTYFYDFDPLDFSKTQEEINSRTSMVRNLLAQLNQPLHDLNACDFGMGRGTLAYGLSEFCHKVWGIDFDIRSGMGLVDKFGLKDNLFFLENFEGVTENIDIVIMWHVLEHLPFPVEILNKLIEKMPAGSRFLIQIPLYRREHLENAHYLFYNEYSFDRLASITSLYREKTIYDYERCFLTCILKVN